METPAILKGHMYPSARVERCPRFHRCVATHKCQNYDLHQVDCQFCESRCSIHRHLGGLIPEGKILPDIQDAIRCVQETMKLAYAHQDASGQKINGRDISRTYDKFQKATRVLNLFASTGLTDIKEKSCLAMYDVEQQKLLGRME